MAALWCKNESGLRLPRASGARTRTLLKRVGRLSRVRFADVGVTYVTPSVSRSLNRRYLRHDWTTDVLSFTYQTAPIKGELVICLSQAVRQARRAGTSLSRELDRLLVHGLLHLAGYDHVQKGERATMRRLEDRALMASG